MDEQATAVPRDAESGTAEVFTQRFANRTLRDLTKVSHATYWVDFLISWSFAAGGFVLVVLPGPLALRIVAYAVAVLATYRVLLFNHELAHFGPTQLRGFTVVWDLLAGIVFLFPAYSYRYIHLDHHRRTSYGTPRDGEYVPLGRTGQWRSLAIIMGSLFMPLAMVARFSLGPLSLLHPGLRRFVWRRASQTSMTPTYVNQADEPGPLTWTRISELLTSVYAWGFFGGIALGYVPWIIGATWLSVAAGFLTINAIRTIAAHRFVLGEQSTDAIGQYLDSVTVTGGPLTGTWAPVGLRYHALHHIAPAVPYHNLGSSHRRLVASLPRDSLYHAAIEPSLAAALRKLLLPTGRRERDRRLHEARGDLFAP
jgi:fatty acid desaturase